MLRSQELFLGLSPTTALVVLLAFFTAGALANAGRVLLFRSAGFRIVARLRSEGYRTALRQDIEYVERGVGEGDLVSRLNNDSGIVGERCVRLGSLKRFMALNMDFPFNHQCDTKPERWAEVGLSACCSV